MILTQFRSAQGQRRFVKPNVWGLRACPLVEESFVRKFTWEGLRGVFDFLSCKGVEDLTLHFLFKSNVLFESKYGTGLSVFLDLRKIQESEKEMRPIS